MNFINKALGAGCLITLAGTCYAEPIHFHIGGTITAINDGSVYTPFPFVAVHVGDTWSASFTIDSLVQDSNSSTATGAYAPACGSLTVGTITVDMTTPRSRCARISISPDNLREEIALTSSPNGQGPFVDEAWYIEQFSAALWNSVQTDLMINDALDQSFQNLSSFDSNAMSLLLRRYQWDPFTVSISGNVTSYTAGAETPLPAAAWLLGGALAGLAATRCRQTEV